MYQSQWDSPERVHMYGNKHSETEQKLTLNKNPHEVNIQQPQSYLSYHTAGYKYSLCT